MNQNPFREGFALRLVGVSKSYGAVRALDNLSFDVAEGRFFVLFGPSSVGKTTALRTIAGLVKPDAAVRIIFGKDYTHAPIAGRGVSMVFQSFALYPHLTVYENLAYPLREEKVAPREDRQAGQGNRSDAEAFAPPGAQAQHPVGRRTAACCLGPFA